MYTHVMIDLETLGSSANAVTIQIGAAYFDPTTKQIGNTFKVNIDPDSEYQNGFDYSGKTIYWWLTQSQLSIKSILQPPLLDSKQAWNLFNDFMQPCTSFYLSAVFDFPIIKSHIERFNIYPKFKYRYLRDIRTITTLANMPDDLIGSTYQTSGTPHDALDDCIYQIAYTSDALSKL